MVKRTRGERNKSLADALAQLIALSFIWDEQKNNPGISEANAMKLAKARAEREFPDLLAPILSM